MLIRTNTNSILPIARHLNCYSNGKTQSFTLNVHFGRFPDAIQKTGISDRKYALADRSDWRCLLDWSVDGIIMCRRDDILTLKINVPLNSFKTERPIPPHNVAIITHRFQFRSNEQLWNPAIFFELNCNNKVETTTQFSMALS
jgi:hypothetical protein